MTLVCGGIDLHGVLLVELSELSDIPTNHIGMHIIP